MRKMRKGFTLVELLIVVAIIGVLGASMSLAAKDSTPKAQVAALISDFKMLRTAAVMYNIDSSDKGATLTYFKNHSNDYLAGKLKKFSLTDTANNVAGTKAGQWLATYKGGLSVAAQKAFTDSKDLGITYTKDTKGNLTIMMRIY